MLTRPRTIDSSFHYRYNRTEYVDSGQCGIATVQERPRTPHRRIASGMTSTPGAHPWTASIRLQGDRRTFHHCGAVVLSEYYVLTAGHCMEDHPRKVIRVRVGDWDMEVSLFS